MATGAVARETIVALRRQIARIEGTLPERLEAPGAAFGADAPVIRRDGVADSLLRTGIGPLDAILGGGLPKAALTEIHGAGTRDAGAVVGSERPQAAGRGLLRRALTPHLNGLVKSRSECHNGTATWLPSKRWRGLTPRHLKRCQYRCILWLFKSDIWLD